jgi:hypothetical protein
MIMWSRDILTRLRGHPSDDRLAVLALAPGDVSPDDAQRDAETHVRACARCAERLSAMVRLLAGARAAAEAEADEFFTPTRLDRQHSQILRRLGAGRMPARVIPFPLPPRPQSPVRQVARRWVAAAAAAGLLVGVAGGRLVGPQPASILHMVGRGVAPAPEHATPISIEAGFTEEEFLVELDAAAFQPRIEQLRVLDELTPRVQPISSTR